MERPDEFVRLFSVSDAEMFAAAKEKKAFLIEDKADFESFDRDFNEQFFTDFASKITAAEITPDDEAIQGVMKHHTDIVEEKMKDCRNLFQRQKYFIDKAFPDDSAKQVEFGYREYNSARAYQNKMVQFMRELHTVSLKYLPELEAVGFSKVDINSIETKRAELDNANVEQNIYVKNRATHTQDRVNKLNEVWVYMQKVCLAGKIIFADNFAKYKRYLLPDDSSAGNVVPPPPPPEP